MRILVVTNLWPSTDHPAFGSFVAHRVDALRELGATTRVVGEGSGSRRGRYSRLAMSTLTECARRHVEYDVVEAHIAFPTGMFAWPIALRHRTPMVLFAHGADIMQIPRRSRVHATAARLLLGRADHIICNSQFLAEHLESDFKVPRERWSVISPGIVAARFISHARPPANRDGLLFVGQLIPNKGAQVLLQALSILQRTESLPTLMVMGDGPERGRLEGYVRQHRLDVQFAGERPADEVAAAMGRASVVVVPSTYEEPLGLVALEAMAAGALVVGSDTGGLAELLTDGRGLTTRPADADALAQAICDALHFDPVDARGRTDAARDYAVRHDVVDAARRTLALYDELSSASGRRPGGDH